MSYSVSLSSCRAKLRQARVHRDELESYIKQYFDIPTNRPVLSAEKDLTGGDYIFRIASVPPIAQFQETVALMVGDCIHNIRSSLDHLAYQLACLNKNGRVDSPHQIQFPIEQTAEAFAEKAKRWLAEIRKDHQDVIESYQPYYDKAGRSDRWSGDYIHQLTLLQQLSNSDKHRILTPIPLVPSGLEVEYLLPPEVGIYEPEIRSLGEFYLLNPFRNMGEKIEIGIEICRNKLIGDDIPSTIENAGYVIPHMALEEKRPIVPTLKRLEKYVELIFDDFQLKLT